MSSPENPFLDVPQQIVDLSSNLVDFVERAVGIRPDFSPETLSIVDHYAKIARAEVEKRPELHDLPGRALGAYFGEVVRRSEGAFWSVTSANFHDWSLCGVSAFVAINPMGVGFDALLGSMNHGGPSSQFKLGPEDREGVSARLAALPEVPEDEYYTLCTRFEVTQIIMEAVRGLASQRGYEDMVYTEADYADGLRPLGYF